jgi:hypothetical protein
MAEKFYFYLQQQLLRKKNLDPIFSESRFGTIAHKKINYGRHPVHQPSANFAPKFDWEDMIKCSP